MRETFDKTAVDRVGDLHEYQRHGARRLAQRRQRRISLDKDKIRRKRDQFPCMSAHALRVTHPLGEAIIDSKVAALLPAKSLQPVQKCSVAGSLLWIVLSQGNERADAPHPLRLLGAHGKRRRGRRRATESRKELAPSHRVQSPFEAALGQANALGRRPPYAVSIQSTCLLWAIHDIPATRHIRCYPNRWSNRPAACG